MYISMSLYIERDFFAREEVKESNKWVEGICQKRFISL